MPRMSESGPGRSPSRLSCSRRRAGISAGSPMKRLTKKDPAPARRPRRARRRAPGPVAAAMAPVAPQRAVAVARCSSGNSGSSRAREVGTRIAAPAACTTRARDQHLDRGRQPADRPRRRGRSRRRRRTSAAGPRRSASRPGRDQEGGEDDVVGVEDPGQAGERRVGERLHDVREGDVDDGDVEEAHEDGDRGDEQHLPALLHATDPSAMRCVTQLIRATLDFVAG